MSVSHKTQKRKQCYIVYGHGFNPMKIKGINARNKLITRIKNSGFTPKYVATSRSCTRKATLYNRIPGAKTIR
jgi:hypothetical protein